MVWQKMRAKRRRSSAATSSRSPCRYEQPEESSAEPFANGTPRGGGRVQQGRQFFSGNEMLFALRLIALEEGFHGACSFVGKGSLLPILIAIHSGHCVVVDHAL